MRTPIILIALATVLALSLFAVGFSFYLYVSYGNQATALEVQYEAKHQQVQGKFDNMWRIVAAKAGVAVQYKTAFLEVIKAQTEGRKGGDVMKFVQEVAPGLDPSIYRDVSNAVEAQRTGFLSAETELLAIVQEHTNLLRLFPSNLFLASHKPLVYKVITSERTDKTFATGHDDSPADPFQEVQKDGNKPK